MKDTGIVRRIDELGRIVIPKEIRKTLRLNEGTQMEIYTTNEGELVFKKFSIISEIKDYSEIFCTSLSSTSQKSVIICDTDTVLSCGNAPKKDYLHKPISEELEKIIADRKSYILNVSENSTTYPITLNDKNNYTSQIVVPIIVNSDIVGAIIMFSTSEGEPFNTCDVKVVQSVSNLFAAVLEQWNVIPF